MASLPQMFIKFLEIKMCCHTSSHQHEKALEILKITALHLLSEYKVAGLNITLINAHYMYMKYIHFIHKKTIKQRLQILCKVTQS